MIFKPRSPYSPIGIDIGSRRIKAVQITGAGEQPRLHAAVALHRHATDEALLQDEISRLCTVLRRRGFVGNRVVVAIPNEAILTGLFDLPPQSSGAPLDQIAQMELARTHRLDGGQLEAAHWPLPQAGAGESNAVMAAGCTHEAADALLDAIEGAGLTVCGLDMDAWALLRACRQQLEGVSGVVAAVNLGWQSASFELLYQDVVVYQRSLDGCGVETLINAVKKENDLDDQVIDYLLFDRGFKCEDLDHDKDVYLLSKVRPQLESYLDMVSQELNLSMAYAQHQYPDAPVEHLWLLGGGASIPGVDEYVSQIIEAQVTLLRLADVVACANQSSAEAMSPSFVIAAGLAQYPREIAA